MKKISYISLLCVCSSIAFAQLKVTPDGKVGVGITATPSSRFSVGTAGEQYVQNAFYSDIVTMQIQNRGNPNGISHYWGTSLQIFHTATTTRGDKGIECYVQRASPENRGKTIGIMSCAGNASDGYNYGVIGSLGGSNNGTGILGIIGNQEGIYIDGRYAGYFSGNVKVTGVVNGVVVGNSDIRYKQNVEELGVSDVGAKEKESVLSNIMQLNPISYHYKQMYLGTENVSDTASTAKSNEKQAMYDERSQMFQKKHFGLVAQDLQQVYPDLVYENDNGYLSINYIELIPLLVQSIKELKAEVDLLAMATVKTHSATSSDAINDIPRAVLYQNAPNPFSDKTEIKFDLPDNAVNTFIMIFNMQGSLVKQIPVNTYQKSITVNGSELTAGMYLYSLIIDGREADTKRMILTK